MGRPGALALVVALAALSACGRKSDLPGDALDQTIARAIGDPATCVLIADRATKKVLYTYGEGFNCQRGLPACDRPGTLSAQGALMFADAADPRTASCASNAAGDRAVAWAEGRVAGAKRDLVYSAVMEGARVLPGMEVAARLDQAFKDAGLSSP